MVKYSGFPEARRKATESPVNPYFQFFPNPSQYFCYISSIFIL